MPSNTGNQAWTSSACEPGADIHGVPAPIRISVEDLSKTYTGDRGTVEALRHISGTVRAGEFVSIVGASGCGKTTLLWCLSGLHPPTSGCARVDGTEMSQPLPAKVGMVFQDSNLLPWRTVMQNIIFPSQIRRQPVDETKVAELIEIVGLVGFEDAYPRELSGGMRQRASIVRALSQDPEVLLMDEPFGALDAFTRDEMNMLLLRLWEQTGKTIVFVTHSIPEAILLSDRIWVMSPRPGRIVEVVEVGFQRPRHSDLQFEPDFIAVVKEIRAFVERGSTSGASESRMEAP